MSDETLDVFGWLADRQGCGHIRMMTPLDVLGSETGLKVGYDEALSTRGLMPKVIIGQRVCKDGPSRLWQVVAEQPNRPKIVYELDDDLWNIDVSNYKAYRWFIEGFTPNGEYHSVQENLPRNIAVADAVTCTTEALADIIRQWNSNVKIVPNYLPAWLLDWDRPRRDKLTIGWGGSGTHSMDWDSEGPQIKRFLQRNQNVDFRLIGTGNGSHIGLPDERVSAAGWVPNVEEYWKTIDYDIGVIPLRHHIFNQSKSSLKFMENAFLGIPTVASNAGPYSSAIEHGVTGFLVKRDHEWGKYLRDLVEDEDMRTEIGANAKKWAQTQTLEGHISEWTDALCRW